MQWSHIKTLFILCFLMLNIYLLYQFIGRQEQQDIPSLDSEDQSLEEQLERENIEVDIDQNQDIPNLSYLSVAQRPFETNAVEDLNDLDSIEATLSLDRTLLFATLEEPIAMPEEGSGQEVLQNIITPFIMQSSQYTYGGWDKELNIVMFFQMKEGYPIYLNQQALLLLYLNDDNEITHYTQTMLGEVEEQGDRSIISPIDAVRLLLNSNNGYLRQDQYVGNPELGFYSRIEEPEGGGEMVFAPTWKVTVDESYDYFVNGFEGLIYPGFYTKSLRKMIEETYLPEAHKLDEENKLKENIIQLMEGKLEQTGSEDE